MLLRGLWEKYKDHIAVLLTVLCNVVLMSLLYDFYYDLNDDVMIKDVLAGVYTGTPDGHNMQTLYILGVVISFFYRVFRNVPWYGLFLCLCQFISIYLVGVRLLNLCKSRAWKCVWLVMLTLFIWSVPLLHMVAVQYTIVCGVMVCAAVFLFMTAPGGLSVWSFLGYNRAAVMLVIVAFWLRTEMALLLFPFIAAAGSFRFLMEERPLRKVNFLKYGLVMGTILLGMGFGLLVDRAAYSSPEWRDFSRFFDDRTRLYDFHMDVVTDGTHAGELAGLGVSEAQQMLLANYNFGLDESIDEQMMAALADYADGYAAQNTDVKAHLAQTAGRYRYRIIHLQDGSYSVLALLGYITALGAGVYTAVIRRGRDRFLLLAQGLLLMLVRTVPWMYILLKGREPARIIHPLYLAEFAVLMGMLCLWLHQMPEMRRAYLPAAVWALALACMIPGGVQNVQQDMQLRRQANKAEQAIAAYCREDPDSFYFEDVYSTVSFSEKMFCDVDNSVANRDIMGGWMCKSPLCGQKLAHYDIASAAEGLLKDKNVYIIIADDSPGSDTGWLTAYYHERGISVKIRQIDRINGTCGVYQVRR